MLILSSGPPAGADNFLSTAPISLFASPGGSNRSSPAAFDGRQSVVASHRADWTTSSGDNPGCANFDLRGCDKPPIRAECDRNDCIFVPLEYQRECHRDIEDAVLSMASGDFGSIWLNATDVTASRAP